MPSEQNRTRRDTGGDRYGDRYKLASFASMICLCTTLVCMVATGCHKKKREPVREVQGAGYNVLFVSFDCLRYDHVGANGYEFDTSPTLDSLAGVGTNFSRAYAQSSWTGATHASMMTSLYPTVHGVNTTPIPDPLPPGTSTLAEQLQNAGYHTGAFVSGTYLKSVFGLSRGFDVYDDDFFARRQCDDVNKSVIQWLNSLDGDDNPFFLFVHYFDIHIPYNPPPPYNTMFDPDYTGNVTGKKRDFVKILKQSDGELDSIDPREFKHAIALYDGAIRYTDRACGELIYTMRAKGLLDHTLIIATADHGEAFLDHPRQWTHGRSLYEEVIHIPLIIILPDTTGQTHNCEAIIGHIDLAPTILDVLDLPIPDEMQGSSFLELLSGTKTEVKKSAPDDNTKPAFSELIKIKGKVHKRMLFDSVVTDRWKLIKDKDTGDYELFDIKSDPREQTNVASRFPEIVETLAEVLESWSEENIARSPARETQGSHQYDKKLLDELRKLGYYQ